MAARRKKTGSNEEAYEAIDLMKDKINDAIDAAQEGAKGAEAFAEETLLNAAATLQVLWDYLDDHQKSIPILIMHTLGILPGGCVRPDLALGALSVSVRPPAPYAWPVSSGYVTSPFGMRVHPKTGTKKFHGGLDIGKGSGASIVAPADGRVTYRNDDVTNDAGRYIVVEHEGGWKTSYLHLLTSPVSVGQRVTRGQQIGLMGSTGSSTAPHLHWILRDPSGSAVDPLLALRGSFPVKGGGSISGQYGGLSLEKVAFGALVLGGLYWWHKKRR